MAHLEARYQPPNPRYAEGQRGDIVLHRVDIQDLSVGFERAVSPPGSAGHLCFSGLSLVPRDPNDQPVRAADSRGLSGAKSTWLSRRIRRPLQQVVRPWRGRVVRWGGSPIWEARYVERQA